MQKQGNTLLPDLCNRRQSSVLAVYKTVGEFAIEFNLQHCMQRYKSLNTPQKALQAASVLLKELAGIYTQEKIEIWISAWLLNLSEMLGFELTEQQADIAATLLYSEIQSFNLAELTLFFANFMKGKYGIFYGKFDIQTLTRAAAAYRKERGKILLNLTSEEQNRIVYG